MKRFTITIISAMLCGLVVLSACGGAKKNVQDAEGQAEAGGNAPGGYLMPAISANNFCGDFTTMTPDCENSAYVATEKVAGKYYYLCGDAEARYKFEDLFVDERCAEFKNLVDNYGK